MQETLSPTAAGSSADALPYTRAGWARGYESQPNEYEYWIDDIEGEIPHELHGTLYRNGPGLLDVNGEPIHHPFDGDGMVNMFAFQDGRAYYRNRFVRTDAYYAERAAGKILYRGVFGTQKPGGLLDNMLDLKLKNIANTNIIHWGGKLLALWEAAEPHRLDPYTLDTFGIDRLNGLLQAGDPFAAHPHIDPFCHWDGGEPCLVNFAVKPGFPTIIRLFEFAPSGKLLRQQAYNIGGFAFLHDMAITPNYIIFFQNPIRYNPLPYALGWQSAAQGLASQPGQPTRIRIFPRHPSVGTARDIDSEPGFVWHHANAFEEGNTLVVDSVWYDSYVGIGRDDDYHDVDFPALPPGQLWRTRIDLDSGSTRRELIDPRCCEFPVLHPANVGRPYRYTYLAAAHQPVGNAPLQAVMKVDLEAKQTEVWSAAPHGYVDEPIFVPRPRSSAVAAATTPDVGDALKNTADGEDNGWLLTLVYNAELHVSELVIHDAQRLAQGPMAVLRLKHHIPHGLHGSFTSHYFGPEQDAMA